MPTRGDQGRGPDGSEARSGGRPFVTIVHVKPSRWTTATPRGVVTIRGARGWRGCNQSFPRRNAAPKVESTRPRAARSGRPLSRSVAGRSCDRGTRRVPADEPTARFATGCLRLVRMAPMSYAGEGGQIRRWICSGISTSAQRWNPCAARAIQPPRASSRETDHETETAACGSRRTSWRGRAPAD